MGPSAKPNGCGAADSHLDSPDLRLTAACNEHDLAYAVGGTPEDRNAADRFFLQGMLLKASQAPRWKAAYLYPAAWAYYAAVRLGGWRHWGKPKPR